MEWGYGTICGKERNLTSYVELDIQHQSFQAIVHYEKRTVHRYDECDRRCLTYLLISDAVVHEPKRILPLRLRE